MNEEEYDEEGIDDSSIVGLLCIGKDCGICGGEIPSGHEACRCGSLKRTIHYGTEDNHYCPMCGSVSATVHQVKEKREKNGETNI